MNQLRDALGELADQAKVYDVTGRAIGVARRRRQAARLAPVAAAAAVVVAVGLVAVVGLRPDPSGGQVVAAPPSVGWLPDRLDLPATPPDPLPATGAPGRGMLLYGSTAPDAGPPVLLTSDGRHHRLAEPVYTRLDTHNLDKATNYPGLSPDGRWLGERRAGRYVVRDLTGTARFELADGHAPVAWSPDSRWLLLANNGDETAPPIRLDLTSGQQQPVPLGDRQQWSAKAVLPDGTVLLDRIWGSNKRNRTFDARIVDPVSGRDARRVEVNLAPYLERQEGRTWDLPRLSPDGRSVLLTVVRMEREDGVPGLEDGGALLLLDLTGGKARRVDLPQTPGTRWTEPLGYLPEGILLRMRVSGGGGDALQVLDPETSATATVIELPTDVRMEQVVPRGA